MSAERPTPRERTERPTIVGLPTEYVAAEPPAVLMLGDEGDLPKSEG